MKTRWWLYALLVLSLAVNVGALGFYGLSKYQDWRSFQSYRGKWFRPGTTEHQLGRLLADLDKSRAPWADTMQTAIRQLGLLAQETNPDSMRVTEVLDRIERCEREESRLLRMNSRGLKRLYRPEKLEFWRKRMQAERDSVLEADQNTVPTPGRTR
jgi:hypothetical protein